MKKLYNSKGPKRVHPSPPSPSPSPSPSPPLLSSLPTALLALASTLSPQEQEVLSYLLDPEKLKENQPKSKNKKKKDKIDNNYNHAPDLGCSCFGCYKSFWARWDASPNRHVIHLILDAFEETLESKEANRKKKRALKSKKIDFDEVLAKEMSAQEEKVDADDDAHDDVGNDDDDDDDGGGDDGYDGDDGHGDDEEAADEEEKSSVRRFVSWVFGMNN